jgi:hypothetical protein
MVSAVKVRLLIEKDKPLPEKINLALSDKTVIVCLDETAL